MTVGNKSCKALPMHDHAVLLLGNYRPAVVAARKLSARGYKVILGASGGEGGAEYSRHVDHVWHHPEPARDSAGFLNALNELLAVQRNIKTVLPVAEEFVVFLANHGHTLPDDVATASPKKSIVKAFCDKINAINLARSCGVPCLPFSVVQNSQQLSLESRRIGFPLIVRPLGVTARIGHKKAVIVEGPEDLDRLLPRWPAGHQQLLVQRFARGERHNVYFAADRGELLGAVQSRIFRTDHTDGTGLAVDGKTVPLSENLAGDTKALTGAVGYTGIGLAQFIVDPETGARCFLELNPRVSGSHAVPEAAGLPLTEIAVDLAHGIKRPCQTDQPAEFRYAWTYGDLRALKSAIARKEISAPRTVIWAVRSLASAFAADLHMTWDWRDPVPTLALFCARLPGLPRLWPKPPAAKTIQHYPRSAS